MSRKSQGRDAGHLPAPPPIPPESYLIPALIALVVITVTGFLTVAIVAVKYPDNLSVVNGLMIVSLSPVGGLLFLYVKRRLDGVERQLDGRLTQFFDEFESSKSDQRMLGYGQGQDQERRDEAGRQQVTRDSGEEGRARDREQFKEGKDEERREAFLRHEARERIRGRDEGERPGRILPSIPE